MPDLIFEVIKGGGGVLLPPLNLSDSGLGCFFAVWRLSDSTVRNKSIRFLQKKGAVIHFDSLFCKYIERKIYEQRNDLKTKSIYKDSCAGKENGVLYL